MDSRGNLYVAGQSDMGLTKALAEELIRVEREQLDAMLEREEAVELTKKQLREMARTDKRLRANKLRNLPCPCGSGKKFKKCCGRGF